MNGNGKKSMTFKDYWDDLMTKKPIKDGQCVKMSKEQFHNMQKKAFTKGFFEGVSKIKSVKDVDSGKNCINDLFKDLFGKGLF